MQVRALKTWNNSKQEGLVREGMILTVNDRRAQQLIKAGLVEPTPESNKMLPGAERRKDVEAGNAQRDEGTAASSQHSGGETRSEQEPESGATEDSSEDPPAGGRRRRSSSPRRGPRSPKSK